MLRIYHVYTMHIPCIYEGHLLAVFCSDAKDTQFRIQFAYNKQSNQSFRFINVTLVTGPEGTLALIAYQDSSCCPRKG